MQISLENVLKTNKEETIVFIINIKYLNNKEKDEAEGASAVSGCL